MALFGAVLAVLVAAVAAQQAIPPTVNPSPSGPDGVFYNPVELPQNRLTLPTFTPCANGTTAQVANNASDCKPFTGPDVGFAYLMQRGTNYPEQVQVTPAGPNGSFYHVKFQTPNLVSGAGQLLWAYSDLLPLTIESAAGIVRCANTAYSVYESIPALAYQSGSIFTCLVGPLPHNTRIYYTIRKPAGNTEVYNFKSAQAPGKGPLKLALVADCGQTVNASSTFDNVIAGKPDFVLWAGDLSYADDYNLPCVHFNGTEYTPQPGTNAPPAGQPQICGIGGYKWDSWGRLVEKLVAFYPTTFVPGNHELETVPLANSFTPFIAYTARVPGFVANVQSTKSYPNPPLAPRYYSLNIGLVHVLGFSTYEGFTKYTNQYNFITYDLAQINKTVTPWFFGMSHTPWYNTDNSHYEEGAPIRGQYETLFYNAGMDLHQFGHVHAYERSWPVYQYRIDLCGPVHVTVGDGGTIEAVAGPFLVDSRDGNFAYYSAARDYYFGHSEVEFFNGSTAQYTWYRNYAGLATAYDSFTLTSKSSLGCPLVKGS